MFRKSILCIFYFYLSSSKAEISVSDNYLIRCNEKLIEVIMEDLFTPPVASRVHVYPNIAAFEVLCINNPELSSLSGPIKHLQKLNLEKSSINYSIAAEFAFTTVAKKLVFSEYLISDFEKKEIEIWKNKKIDTTLIRLSVDYGIKAGRMIIDWAVKDGYIQLKTMERYVLSEKVGAWRPTAPEYTNAVEPHWNTMRTLVTDSSSQIKPIPNISYSEKKSSTYYKNAYTLYKTSLTLDTTKKMIAQFWDCNPNISYSTGHLTYFVHKISPGGHWVLIAGQACRNLNFDELKTAQVYTLLTIGLFEGFISCWTEKYKSEAIRPETYINRLIDPKWLPYIQTPPFPEYTSGHSVISSASATILTRIIPQPYEFTDSSEMYINIPPRHFKSFREASDEASISRFYGGIHYMPSLDNGIKQGNEVGNYVLQKLYQNK
jgi:hypothetical protein